MARFFGTVQGGRGEATRLGHANTGLHVSAQSYHGSVVVMLDDEGGETYVTIGVARRSCRHFDEVLYRGPIAALFGPGARIRLLQEAVLDTVLAEAA